jgi:drug/metabolite transporter (DMT)-like permease
LPVYLNPQFTSVTSVTAIFSMTPGLVFIFGWFILREPITIFRSIAVVLSIGRLYSLFSQSLREGGVLCISFSNGNVNGEWIGDVLTVLSALAAALYKVFFKHVVGDGNSATVSAFLSCIGVFNLTVMWVMPGLK